MRRIAIWFLAGISSAAVSTLIFFPATWIDTMVEKKTAGRLTLGDAQGTLWRGSAFIGGAASDSDAVTPLIQGRFSWRLSPMVLLGSVDIELENTAALSHPVSVTGSWNQWHISPSAVILTMERLAALGAPLNTVKPSGQMRLSWGLLQLGQHNRTIELFGPMNLEMNDIASRLSPIKPLGSYNLSFDWLGRQAAVELKTNKGPMLLSGKGVIANGRFQFYGRAEAETGQEEKLANLIHLLGQRRREGDKNFIALEFK